MRIKQYALAMTFGLLLWQPLWAAEQKAAEPKIVDMELKQVDGQIDQLSQYRGKWVVVNYWATWCPPCREEMPELQGFHDDHKDSDGVVLGINAEEITAERLNNFLDDYFISYPNYVAGPVYRTELGVVPGLPTTYLLTPEGELVARQVGGVTQKVIEDFIQRWEAKQKED